MKKQEPTLSHRLWISGLLLLSLLVLGSIIAAIFSSEESSGDANTAIIMISGPIMGGGDGGLFSEGITSSAETVVLLEKARDDDNIKAVLLEINSPGGSAVASDEIAMAVKDLRENNKTVVSWVRESGASGAYWIASSSDYIVAHRMSVTGSIGVISSYMSFGRFLNHWNVTYNRLVAGDNKDVGDPFKELSPQEKAFLQGKLDTVHRFFIEEVARNRNMSYNEVERLADGRFFLGVEAKEVGLIDELGGKEQALAYIEARIGEEAVTEDYVPEQGFFNDLFGAFGRQRSAGLFSKENLQYLESDVPVPMLR